MSTRTSNRSEPWVDACYAAIDAAAAGKDPSGAVDHLPAQEADRALTAALTIIEKVAWLSDLLLRTPGREERWRILNLHTRQNKGMRQAVETRVKRLWNERGARSHDKQEYTQ